MLMPLIPLRTANKIVRVGPQMYSIDDPATARILYGVSSPFPKSKWYEAWGDPRIPNHNLFNARDRNVHGIMRRKVASMYAMTTIKSYEPYTDSCVDLLLQRLDEFAANGRTFDLQKYLQCYAFDVIGAITVS
jgi:cytochrome P450